MSSIGVYPASRARTLQFSGGPSLSSQRGGLDPRSYQHGFVMPPGPVVGGFTTGLGADLPVEHVPSIIDSVNWIIIEKMPELDRPPVLPAGQNEITFQQGSQITGYLSFDLRPDDAYLLVGDWVRNGGRLLMNVTPLYLDHRSFGIVNTNPNLDGQQLLDAYLDWYSNRRLAQIRSIYNLPELPELFTASSNILYEFGSDRLQGITADVPTFLYRHRDSATGTNDGRNFFGNLIEMGIGLNPDLQPIVSWSIDSSFLPVGDDRYFAAGDGAMVAQMEVGYGTVIFYQRVFGPQTRGGGQPISDRIQSYSRYLIDWHKTAMVGSPLDDDSEWQELLKFI